MATDAQLVPPPEATMFNDLGLPLDVPLCVDLDGTLVKSDTLFDSTMALVRQRPSMLIQLPGWLMRGKAALKRHVTSAVQLDVAHLPYNRELMQFLEQQHATGRPIFLATAADTALAQRVADHVGLFAGVLASDGTLNLAGKNKLAAFQSRFGDNFCYIGNASPDIPLLTHCLAPMVANPSASLTAGLRRARIEPVRSFVDKVSTLKAWLKAIRLHQWAKNVLIFLPLLLAHAWNKGLMAGTLIAFVSFGLCASATYIVNDLLDIEADRKHIKKRRRPFASGDLSIVKGVAVVGLFLAASLTLALSVPYVIAAIDPAIALKLPHRFLIWLGIYAITTSAYSFSLKRMVLVDVIVLSGLYTIRIIAGAAATGIPISPWLAAFSIFFFLSLAFVKRFAELESLRLRGAAPANGRGYLIADIEQLRSFGSASGYVSAFVLTTYISNINVDLTRASVSPLYPHAARLWLLLPILLLWISRLWLLASRGELDEDPVVYAITDKRSLLLGVLVVVVVLSAL